jgi:tetratricopeptide (TPR) repeat protein
LSRKPKKHVSKRKPDAGKGLPVHGGRVGRGSGRAATTVCIFLFLAVVLVFGRTVWFEFVDFDDLGTVSQNPMVSRGLTASGILWAFSHPEVSSWVPLTTISHMLDCQLFGLWAGGHHLTNVLLHGATSVLLLLVLRDMTGSLWRSAFVAALFALHPLRAESVAWITERKDVLSGLFFMLTLGAYTRWTRRPSGSLVWVMVFLALGLLSKPMLVTTPFVLLLLDHWPLPRADRIRLSRLVIEKIPLLLLSIAASIAQLMAAPADAVSGASLATRIANAVASCAAYVDQMFWPVNLAAFYPYPRHGVAVLALISAILLLIVISAAVYRWRRPAPWLPVGWLWYLVMLAPVLGLIQAGEVSRADRYTYLPQIGLYLMVAWTAGSWCAGRGKRVLIAGSLAVGVLVAASIMAFRQTAFWKDSETLWNRALACTINNDTAHYNLGTALLNDGQIDEAIAHYQQTLQANPAYADAHMNLGRAFLQKAMPDEAIAHYRKAIDLKPAYAQAHYNLALALMQKSQVDEAIRHYERAIEINPAYFDARNNLGSALFQAGRLNDAIASYKNALRIDPHSARAHNNLAAALVQKGRIAEAISHYQEVLKIDPAQVKAHNNLAWLLSTSADPKIRNGARALELAKRANELTGGTNPLMLRTLAAAHAEAGQFDDARHIAQQALDLASAQANESLIRGLREDIAQYKQGQPVR